MYSILSTVTTEPALAVNALANGIKQGASILDKLLFDKVCLYELHYPEDICFNLTSYEDENYAVQEVVNEFNTYKSMMRTTLMMVGSLFIGSFADKVGLKFVVAMSLVGFLLGEVVDFVNYAFLEELPLEFLYIEIPVGFIQYVGIYLAVYGLLSRFVTPQQFATRMALMDGIMTVTFTIGTAPSAPIFRAVGYYGVFAISTVLNVIALLLVLFWVKNYPDGYIMTEEEKKAKESTQKNGGLGSFLKLVLIDPLVDLFTTLAKPRTHHMRPLLLVSFAGMLLYYSTSQEFGLIYPYMYLKFAVTPEEYSLFNVVSQVMQLFGLFVLMPFFASVLKLHESQILVIILATGALLQTLSVYAVNVVPGFILTYGLCGIRVLRYPNGRALLTKMIGPEEVPKMYGFINVLTSVIGLMTIPLYRGLYDTTLETFPGAFLLLSASISLLSAFAYLFLFMKKGNMDAAAAELAAKKRQEAGKEGKENL